MSSSKYLVTADIHVTSAQKDEYRWHLFPWLAKTARDHSVDAIFILGDLTEKKDEHTSGLLHRMVRGVQSLAAVAPVFILMGNHDYLVDPTEPFFAFLGQLPGVTWIQDPQILDTPNGASVAFLPHTRAGPHTWEGIDFSGVDIVCCHQCFSGATTPSGFSLSGMSLSGLRSVPRTSLVLAGDIHNPQRVGKVNYVGAPHPTRFGDDFVPRCLLVMSSNDRTRPTMTDLPRTTTRKLTLSVSSMRELERADVVADDHLRLRYVLREEDLSLWPATRQSITEWADALGVYIAEISVEVDTEARDAPDAEALDVRKSAAEPQEVVRSYCAAKEVSETLEASGISLLPSQEE